MWEQENWPGFLLQAALGVLAETVLETSLRKWQWGKGDELTNSSRTQAQNKDYELANLNIQEGHKPTDTKQKDFHNTGQQDIQEEPQWDTIIGDEAEARSLEPDKWLLAVNTYMWRWMD